MNSITSLILLELYYKTDSNEINNYEIILAYHIICYINLIFFFVISIYVKTNIFYLTWRLSVYFIQLAIYIMTFVNLKYTIKYPTYFFTTIHCHIYTFILLIFIVYYCVYQYEQNRNPIVVEYNTENNLFPLIIEKNEDIPETMFPIQTCGNCNQLHHLFLLDCGHTLCENCGKNKKTRKTCPYCGKLFSVLKRIYL